MPDTNPTPPVGSWRLAPPHDAQTQGLVVSPFAHLPEAAVLLLDCTAAPGAAWLRALRAPDGANLRITPATGQEGGPEQNGAGCAAIAFTATGLRQMGVDEATLATFALPFTEGMHALNRRRRLGDTLLELPDRTKNPLWGGNAPPPTGPDPAAVVCERTVHAAILLYHASTDALAAMAAPVRASLATAGVAITHELSLSLMADPGSNPPVTREHFGFADGISQPVPFGEPIITKSGAPYPQDPAHSIAAGDLLIGHLNAHGEPAPGPVLSGPTTLGADIGLNGSYLVIRELSQDVPAFWTSMGKAAAAIGAPNAAWVAERVVGRTKDGVVLSTNPPPSTPDGPGNDFMFWESDADGLQCPLGSHIRRSNPRDGLAASAGDRATLLRAANNHRILRRGRKYAPYAPPGGPELPGLLFMCLNTDLERQFEFVQQTWLMNPSFATLFNEHDPLLGPAGPFTIPALPLRLKPQIDTFVRLIGGEYFFLPSLPALDHFAALGAA
jgi:Dyp-type peroxidase family